MPNFLGSVLEDLLMQTHSCAGKFLLSDPACSKCLLRPACEQKQMGELLIEAKRLDELDSKYKNAGISSVSPPIMTGSRPKKKTT